MKLTVDKITENTDGTVTVNFQMDDEIEDYLKKAFGMEEITEEFLKNMLTDALHNYSKKEE